MDLLTSLVCLRLWRGCRLVVQTCSLQLIALFLSVKFFVQDFLSLLLTCVYHICWIRVHWSWNFSLGVSENFQWAVYKPHIHICFPRRFVEGCGEGEVFLPYVAINISVGFKQLLKFIVTGFKLIVSSFSCWYLLTVFSGVE